MKSGMTTAAVGTLIVGIMVVLMSLPCPAADGRRRTITLEDRVKSVMTEMVICLRERQYQEFVDRYLSPHLYRLLKKNDDLDNVVYNLQERTGEQLRDHLERALHLTPIISKNRQFVEFRDQSFDKPLIFKKINKRWFLYN